MDNLFLILAVKLHENNVCERLKMLILKQTFKVAVAQKHDLKKKTLSCSHCIVYLLCYCCTFMVLLRRGMGKLRDMFRGIGRLSLRVG